MVHRTASAAALAGVLAFGLSPLARATSPAPAPAPDWAVSASADTLEVATFAGGCFWCMEEAFDAVPGVEATVSGYTGGHVEDPGYEQVSSGGTGHVEAVNVFFDPDAVSYAELLDTFWHNVDPTDDGGQFCDRGSQYVSAIFVRNERQRALAETSKRALEAERRIVTPILPATTFYPAEDYHQDYYTKNPVRYRFYKFNCGRKARLEEVWSQAGG
ncbi:MAG TPA: peptide-methionine (S)-S-oxide reductase MsrA [Gemmatimonadota bacterium]|nr:peptide-methionine (S)-S-oxide reductase MsrA [Gemmatimonadota bacterium]